MTLPVVFHELADDELNEAAEHYAQVRRGLGDAFLTAVQATVEALAELPLAERLWIATCAGGR